MGKFLKYDLKSNKKYLFRVTVINLLLVVMAFIGHNIMGLGRYLSSPILVNLVFTFSIVYFVAINVIFVFGWLNKDFYRPRCILTFSLPIKESQYVWAKSLGVAVVYLINLVFLLVFLKILAYKVSSDMVYYFLVGLLWIVIFTNLTLLTMQKTRFNQGRLPFIRVLLVFIVIMLIAYVVCKYMSFVMVNGSIQKAGPMGYAFIYPFAIGNLGIYKNLTPLIYYLLVAIFMIYLNSRNLKNKLDLS